MTEAWVHTPSTKLPALKPITAALINAGFTACRTITADERRPPDAAADSRPDLLLVLGDLNVAGNFSEATEFLGVPLIIAVEPSALGDPRAIRLGDELIVLPCSSGELILRARRARSRATGAAEDDLILVGTLEINLATYQVSVDSRPIDMTFKEYELLRFFMLHPGRAFGRAAILSHVWSPDYYGGVRTVDVHVRRIRAKLGHEHAQRITTVRGVGYRFDATT